MAYFNKNIIKSWMAKKHVGLFELSVSGDVLLEAQEHELEPQVGQHQHEQHIGKSKAEPARKVYHATVFREDPSTMGEKDS